MQYLQLISLSLLLFVTLANCQCTNNCTHGAMFIITGGPPTTVFGTQSAVNALLATVSAFGTTVSASDSCNVQNICGNNSTCTAIDANLVNCSCHTGYDDVRTTSSFACVDIDECSNSTYPCHADATCTNTDGSFTCACNPGYSGNGFTMCADIDECVSNPCPVSGATCINGINNYTCVCSSGFSGNGVNCTDVDECASPTACDVNANCTNTLGSHTCVCDPLYTGDGFNCSDLDECAHGTDNCTTNATCVNIPNGFTCVCNASFTGDGHTCTEIDQCLSSPCDLNANCTDMTFGYTCACISGFTGDGHSCTNIDDCTNTSCTTNATCTDLVNTFSCACDTGFTGNGLTTCTDIDECTSSSACGINAICTNTMGSYTCACDTANGFFGNPMVQCDNRVDQTVNFGILCTSHAFVSDLNNASSSAYQTLTSALQSQVDSIISGLDSVAVTNCSYTYTNESAGTETLTAISCLVANTTVNSTNLDIALGGLTENTVCGGQASGDECTNGQSNCSSSQTCADTPYGFCCQSDFQYRSIMNINLPYLSNFSDSSTADHVSLRNAMKDFIENGLAVIATRGCSPNFMINVDHVSNGSTIAVFTLSISNATFTVQEITDVLASLSASSTSTILGGSVTSFKDYDECADDFANLRDCDAFASCLNTNGSFSCSCNSTHYDNSTGSLPGRVCLNPVIVSCDATSIKAAVLTSYYTGLGANINDLHLLDLDCNKSSHAVTLNDTLEFTFLTTECNTTTTSNSTHVILENQITNVIPTAPFTGYAINVPVHCVYLRSANVSFNLSGSVNSIQLPPTQAIGEFLVVYGLYPNNSFIAPNPAGTTYLSTDTLYARIYIVNQIGSSSIKVERCWGTAYPGQTSAPSTTYINDTCSTDDVVEVDIIQNGNGDAMFSHQAFFFPVTNAIYLHCDISVCAGVCTGMPTCPSKRRRREAVDGSESLSEDEASGTITIVIKQDPNDPFIPINDITNVIHTNNVTITVIASILGLVLIILLAVIVVFVCRKSRARKEEYELHHVNMHAIDKPPTYRV